MAACGVPELPEELGYELEALQATYGADAVHVGRCAGPALTVSLPLAPRAAAEHERFVAARLVLEVGLGYPEEPPRAQLVDAKGLSDAQLGELAGALGEEAAGLAGELSLGQLVETALELLSAANRPHGPCSFCLEPLAAGQPVLRLACYHCYHTACFASWWQWQQRRLALREAQLWAEYKSMAAAKLAEEGIRQEGLGGGGGPCGGGGGGGGGGTALAYVLPCPACRADITPASLAHAWPQLQAASSESWSGGGGGGGGGVVAAMPAHQRKALRAMQRRHAAVKRRQQACGGLVDASHSVSLADLQQAAAAAAAAEAAAAAAAAEAAAAAAAAAAEAAANGAGPAPSSGGASGPGRSGRPPHGGGKGRHGPRGGGARGRGGQQAAAQGAAPNEKGAAGLAAQALEGLKLGQQPEQQRRRQQRRHPPGSGGRGRGGGRAAPAAAPSLQG